MRIDAHQHFWKLARGDYEWITPELGVINRDFQPNDLEPLLREAGIDGTILVQATDTEAETRYLLDLADAHNWILGVVGWVDMEADAAAAAIRAFSAHPKFVGIRPMIQGIEDPQWMLRASLVPAIETLIELDLTFDALVLPRHLEALRAFLDRYKDLTVVIDHGAKPEIRNERFQPWADQMAEIAQASSASCKLSGLLTEASPDWEQEDIATYAAHILSSFGARRTLFGSDWPVLNLAGSYADWFRMMSQWVPAEAAAAVFGGNAARCYLRQR